jgi:hypothetical protein
MTADPSSRSPQSSLPLPAHNDRQPLTVKKAIGDLNFRQVIPFLLLESSISWIKNLFPSPGAFLFIMDVTKIYFYSTDVQKSVVYVRKCIPSSLMQNVEIVSEIF